MEPTPPNSNRGMLMRPGWKAVVEGVRHAYIAAGVKRAIDDYNTQPKKKQTTMPGYKRTYVKKYSADKSKAFASSTVKKTILAMAPTYLDSQNDSTLNVATLLMNNIYTNNITAQIVPGTTVESRQGDEIYLTHLDVKANFYTDPTAGAYQFRIMILKSTEEYDFGAGFGTGLTAVEIFQPTGSAFRTQAVVNPKACTVLHDQIVDVNSQVAAASDVAHVGFRVKLDQKFKYQVAGGLYGKSKNIYCVVIGTRLGATNGVTSTGTVFVNTVMGFKNL